MLIPNEWLPGVKKKSGMRLAFLGYSAFFYFQQDEGMFNQAKDAKVNRSAGL